MLLFIFYLTFFCIFASDSFHVIYIVHGFRGGIGGGGMVWGGLDVHLVYEILVAQ